MASNAMSGVKSPVLKATRGREKGTTSMKNGFPFLMTHIFIWIFVLSIAATDFILYIVSGCNNKGASAKTFIDVIIKTVIL